MVRPRVFLDFSMNDELLGRVILELFEDSVPITCENFRALCTGEKGLSSSGIPLYYKNSTIHRSIKDFMIQGGDFTKRNGSGGESIYGGAFPDENLTQAVDLEGLLCMANKGPNTNGSQFFITLRECSHLNGKHVVFGKVIRGYEEVIKRIAAVPVDEKDRPLTPIHISSCGELELRKKWDINSKPAKRSPSDPDSRDGRETDRRRARRSPSSSPERRHRKKAKRKQRVHEGEGEKKVESKLPVEETEEEYDKRLEREEKIRLAAQRMEELKHIKHQYDSESRNVEGIRFKGRGRMKYVDPEINHRR